MLRRLLIESLERKRLLSASANEIGPLPPPEAESPPMALANEDVIISEFLASNSSTNLDGDGDSSDWIELQNLSDQVVDLSGFHLTDDANELGKWTFPAGSSIEAGGYLLVFASGKCPPNKTDPAGFLHADFKLGAGGEYVALTNPQELVISEFGSNGKDYPAQETDISYGVGNQLRTIPLVAADHPVTLHIPSDGSLGTSWTGVPANEPFDDSIAAGWSSGAFGVGFDVGEFSTDETIGNALIDRPSTDAIAGSIFALTSSPFTQDGKLVQWSMYNNISSRRITPLILRRSESGEFEVTGVGTTIAAGGNGQQAFDFGLVTGSDEVEETYFFGWKDGSNGTDNRGVVEYTNGANEAVTWFDQHTTFGVGKLLGAGQTFARAYSMQATIRAREYDSTIDTEVPAGTTSVYVRTEVELSSPESLDSLTLNLKYDDGIVAYLNGTRVFSDGAPANPSYDSLATSSRTDANALEFRSIDISPHLNLLKDGKNVLALHVLNVSGNSSDLLAVAELEANDVDAQAVGYMTIPTPGAINRPQVEGFVADTTFTVDRGFYDTPVVVEFASATPGATLVYTTDGSKPTMSRGSRVFLGANVSPTHSLLIAATTTLRAAAFKEGFQPTNVDTQTYIFVDDVIQQRALLTNVTNNSTWGPLMDDSLLSIPSISVTTTDAISQTEKEASIELIFPDGSQGFQIDAGIEHYGGHSLNSPKNNMRLSFKQIYGDSKLNFPVFEEASATDEFDQLLLRSGSHDTWFWTHPQGQGGVYFRNRWAYDRQLEMGHAAPHGRFVQVYIDGTYHGLHHLTERPNADFMASYFGGDDSEYNALNAGNPIDGFAATFNRMVQFVGLGRWDQIQDLMDVENYIDYMLLEFYSGNDWDWRAAQNWAGAEGPGTDGYQFFAWDSDVKMRSTPTANVVNKGGPADMWDDISQIPEFRLMLADRVQKHFFNDGVFTADQVRRQVDDLASELEIPVIAETARWSSAYTPNTWQGYVNWIRNSFVPNRTSRVLSQLSSYLPSVSAPSFAVDGSPQHGGSIAEDGAITMSSSSGETYYTLDGSDPRSADGAATGIRFQTPISIDGPTTIKARTLRNGEWSALSDAVFVKGHHATYSNFRLVHLW